MKEIQSTKNPLVKELKKLQQKKHRDQQNRYLLEGFHLVEAAFQAQLTLAMIFVDERGMQQWGEWLAEQQLDYYFVSEEVLGTLSSLPTPQGMIAVVEKEAAQTLDYTGKWLFLDNVQDPGNVGTMIRTADAAGFAGVFLGKGTADIYSTKVLRSMQGSNFHLPIVAGDILPVLTAFQAKNVPIYGTELNPEAVSYKDVPVTEDVVLIMGNEGQGVAQDLLAMTDKNIYIPIKGQAESLNVGIAAGILMYHFI